MKIVKILCFIPVAIIAISITILSHLPNPPSPDFGLEWQDKINHLIAYTCFASSLALSIVARTPDMKKGRLFLWVLVGTAFFGFYDEVHQSFIPNRDASFFDWLADMGGGCISFLLFGPVRKVYAFLQYKFYTSNQ